MELQEMGNKELIMRIYTTEFSTGVLDSDECKELLSRLDQGEKAIKALNKILDMFKTNGNYVAICGSEEICPHELRIYDIPENTTRKEREG